MSVIISTAIRGVMSEFTTIFEGMSAELAIAGTIAAPIAAIGGALVSAVALGEIFTKEWNKERAKIPNVIQHLTNAISKVQAMGKPLADQRREYTRYSRELDSQESFVNNFFGFNINLKQAIEKNKELDDQLVKQVLDWTQILGLAQVAADDNTFYTLHRDDIDKLISVWNARQDAVDSLLMSIVENIKAIQKIFEFIREAHRMAQALTLSEVLTKEEPTIDQLADWVERGLIKGRIAEIIMKITRSLVRTRTKTKKGKKDQAKKKRRNKRKQPKPKKGKKNIPQSVRTITAEVGNNSAWIQKLIFTFPENEPIDSDRAGTLMVYLKKGNPIKFVRVKRGTFSVIAMWSLGMSFGTGFRIWSQFWKKRIVNVGKVFSWFIPRINKIDRQIGIKIEIMEKRVKYK